MNKQIFENEEELQYEIEILANHIKEWCISIDKKGTGWDEWDSFYKDAYYRETEVKKIVDKYSTLHENVEWLED